LNLEDGTDMMHQNVGNRAPTNAAQYGGTAKTSITPPRKPQIAQMTNISLLDGRQSLEKLWRTENIIK